MRKDLKVLELKLGTRFKNTDLLRTALVHRSYLNEHKSFPLEQNERLEFLGDAVIELIVTTHLYKKYKEAEGVLTNWRSSLVNGERLAQLAETLSVYDYMYMSKGESQDSNKKARNYILANALEAIVGAIYLDRGFNEAEDFIEKKLLIQLPKIIAERTYIDSKSMFQEKAQETIGVTPRYKVLSEIGPDHKKKFTVGVYLDKELVAEGDGYSKQEAQSVAAANALKVKHWNS
ncbi:MAG: ribonuclease III [Parcubacteria group bacterium]|nr:MAG: ribonuclease III [Parcubacteria group bacterium]